ncbi:hypothetical protein FRD01_06155 [Microvenator marinus]|uniref:Kazal-like domain-containing protein n=1 Tax=Microvenator marinus TaxID=2600177 RepID=A0A5B8XMH0_9DELT|nr:Kazal-type serine protease inhibitor domain-containing protein [Microvenator marinus]QED26830.1 hypothetical protein FRD01_06155 [Microvenator marinus]
MRTFWILAVILGLVACSDDSPTLGGGISKTDAASQGGTNSDGEDLCELEEWYGDGVCDTFCPQPDEDCGDGTCQSNLDCRNGERCDDGECISDIDVRCSESSPCPAGFYCTWPQDGVCGDEGRQGVCSEVPQDCPNEFAPVCGCDGSTYDNVCQAALSSISVASTGECAEPCTEHEECGANSYCTAEGACEALPESCESNDACPSDYFCQIDQENVCISGEGMCVIRPLDCPEVFMPVCGCDENEYSNSCFAEAAGVNYVDGECQTTCDPDQDNACPEGEFCIDGVCEAPVTCGGLLGVTCEDGQFCNIAIEDACGEADQTGTCQEIPEGCSKEYAPVCGCDAKTYGNACMAAAAGVSVRSEGACSKGPTSGCGGRNGEICGLTEWCDYGGPTGTCGQADQPGTCEPRPDACLAVFDPVCGCDNQTHSNACAAHAAGVDVLHDGACGTTM